MQAVNNIFERAISNSSQPIKFACLYNLVNQLTLIGAHVIEITKICTVTFMKTRNSFFRRCREKRVNLKKTEHGEDMFFKALANRFRLTSKLISCVKEQQNCLWTTFYQTDFMKR